jgi:hypothetical protein
LRATEYDKKIARTVVFQGVKSSNHASAKGHMVFWQQVFALVGVLDGGFKSDQVVAQHLGKQHGIAIFGTSERKKLALMLGRIAV